MTRKVKCMKVDKRSINLRFPAHIMDLISYGKNLIKLN